jgi:pilus assembly protein CpaE
LRSTFGSNGRIDLSVVQGSLVENETKFEPRDASVIIVDLTSADDETAALQRLMSRIGRWPPVIVVTQAFSPEVARRLVHMRVADFLVKPVNPIDVVRACARVAQGPVDEDIREAQIYTFLPAAGGVGVTTIAIQTAMTLLNSGPRGSVKACLVDLDFQHGACADYLDLEPRLDLGEIEPRPERLDRQLLGVMLSFDFVVIDMPRTWFSWTDSVLVGSNRLFIVSEMTVPGLRHAKQLVTAVSERLGQGPHPQVIVNRFEQRMFASGLRRNDIKQALGQAFAGTLPNNYALVREAIDRGIPLEEVKKGNNVVTELKKIVLQQPAKDGAKGEAGEKKKEWSLFWAR